MGRSEYFKMEKKAVLCYTDCIKQPLLFEQGKDLMRSDFNGVKEISEELVLL